MKKFVAHLSSDDVSHAIADYLQQKHFSGKQVTLTGMEPELSGARIEGFIEEQIPDPPTSRRKSKLDENMHYPERD